MESCHILGYFHGWNDHAPSKVEMALRDDGRIERKNGTRRVKSVVMRSYKFLGHKRNTREPRGAFLCFLKRARCHCDVEIEAWKECDRPFGRTGNSELFVSGVFSP
jgi:hypothetical protein